MLDKNFKESYRAALSFQGHFDLRNENSIAGIKANLNLAIEYQKCINETDKPEAKEEKLNKAAEYYAAALTLARRLKDDYYIEKAASSLKAIGRNEQGEAIQSCDASIVIPAFITPF